MVAHPETLRVIETVHDTVRDTVVRVAAPQHHDLPTWVLTTVTAVAAVVAGVLAQWFRVFLDDIRERERIRQVLMIEVAVLGIYLERIEKSAIAWQLPSGSYFWQQLDYAMRGYDELHTKLHLLGTLDVLVAALMLKIKSLRLGAEHVASDYAKEHEAVAKNSVLYRTYDRLFSSIEADAREERRHADNVYKRLYEAVSMHWWLRIGAGIVQKYHSLEDARNAGEERGLLPKKEEDLPPRKPPAPSAQGA
jgi:hypothetical protein